MTAIAHISKGHPRGESSLPASLRRRMDGFYVERMRKSWNGRHILRGKRPGKGDVLLVSNDYLHLADHPDILQSQARAMIRSGNGLLMSAIFLHGASPQGELEREMASFLRSEAAILSQSGWAANVGLVQSIADEETPVYVDFLAHMSLWEGIRAAGARAHPFRHNEPESLEKLICRHGPGIVLVDSVYSTNGGVCPLEEMVAVSGRQGCILVVDESHSLGTHGPQGAGLVVQLGLADQVHFRTASLAKAFSGRGGIIACPMRFRDYFAFTARPAIFSSALLPHELAGFKATLFGGSARLNESPSVPTGHFLLSSFPLTGAPASAVGSRLPCQRADLVHVERVAPVVSRPVGDVADQTGRLP